ncbi:mucin-5AC-like [Thalassophryne amazonica]|uniref:mucin-5AC-like n=1 Tax=Thalassophryne amazonica TaxID=390379 RepID=UPI0014708C07|nr:mucin-5AC-like [Thalassophryne amazonica]
MKTCFLLLNLLLWWSSALGFLITHAPSRLCLSHRTRTIILGRCDVTDPAQHWVWWGGTRLLHTLSSRCLWANPSPHLPRHTRLVMLSDCTDAPPWKCYDINGVFGLAETPLYLKKQGLRLVVCEDPKFSNWTTYDVDSRWNSSSLCADEDTNSVSTIFYPSTHNPGRLASSVYFVKSPAVTGINKEITNTEKALRTTRQVTASKSWSTMQSGASISVSDASKPRTWWSVTTAVIPHVPTSVTEPSALTSSRMVSSSTGLMTTDLSTDTSERLSSGNTPNLGAEAEASFITQEVSTSPPVFNSTAAVTLVSSTGLTLSSTAKPTDFQVTSAVTFVSSDAESAATGSKLNTTLTDATPSTADTEGGSNLLLPRIMHTESDSATAQPPADKRTPWNTYRSATTVPPEATAPPASPSTDTVTFKTMEPQSPLSSHAFINKTIPTPALTFSTAHPSTSSGAAAYSAPTVLSTNGITGTGWLAKKMTAAMPTSTTTPTSTVPSAVTSTKPTTTSTTTSGAPTAASGTNPTTTSTTTSVAPTAASGTNPTTTSTTTSDAPAAASCTNPTTTSTTTSDAPAAASSTNPTTTSTTTSDAPAAASSTNPTTTSTTTSDAPTAASGTNPTTTSTTTSDAPAAASGTNPTTTSTTTSDAPAAASSTNPTTTSTTTSDAPAAASSTNPTTTSTTTSAAPTAASGTNPTTTSTTTSDAPAAASSTNPTTTSTTTSDAPAAASSTNPTTTSTTTSAAPTAASDTNPTTTSTTTSDAPAAASSTNPTTTSTTTSDAPAAASSTNPTTTSTTISDAPTAASGTNPTTTSTTTSAAPTAASGTNPTTTSTTTSAAPTAASGTNPTTTSTTTSDAPAAASSTNPATTSTTTSAAPTAASDTNPTTTSTTTSDAPTAASSTNPTTTSITTSDAPTATSSTNPTTTSITTSDAPTATSSTNPTTTSTTTSDAPTTASSTNPPSAAYSTNPTTMSMTTSAATSPTPMMPSTVETTPFSTKAITIINTPTIAVTTTTAHATTHPPITSMATTKPAAMAPPSTTVLQNTTAELTTTTGVQTTEAEHCSVNVTGISSSSNSAAVTLRTYGLPCNVTVINENTGAAAPCDPHGGLGEVLVCSVADLEPGTLYHLAVKFQKDEETLSVLVRTDPVTPAWIHIKMDLDQAQHKSLSHTSKGTTVLWVSWPRSHGHVDWYDLTLEDKSLGSRRNTRIMSTAAPQSGFSALIPGTIYTVSLVATAGNKSSAPAQTTAATAPSPVSDLQVSSLSSGSINVSWRAGPGRTELFHILLKDQGGLLVNNVTLNSSVTSTLLDDLLPGTLYTVTVVTEAVGLQSATSTDTGTVPASASELELHNNGSSDTLLASWAPPRGGVDSYLVTLSAPGSIPQEVTLTPNRTQAVFQGLTPGQRYQLSVRTTAGGQTSEATTSGRTVPGPVSRLAMSPFSDGKTLRMTWSPPRGQWENYSVVLQDGLLVLVNETISKLSRQHSFTGLVPGRLYTAELTVHSGPLRNTERCRGRLAPQPVQQLVIGHSDQTTMSVLWTRPVGEWDRFTVVLKQVDPAGVVLQKSVSRDTRECTFNDLIPGCLYTVTVTTSSGNMSSSTSVTGWTTPAQVSTLQVSNSDSTDSLHVQWDRATGDLDSYRILLVHDSSVIKNESVRANTTRLAFHALKPGALYRVVLTTVRAGQSSRQTVAEGHTVPAAVGEVTVSNNGRMDFLSVSWRPAAGDVDGYLVTLRDRERTVHTLAVSKSSPECVFGSLVSGRLYNISITSRSGIYENHTIVQERTQPSRVQNPTATHAARDDYLKVYWRHAAGDFDFYRVVIKHNNIFHQNKTVPKTQNECMFNGLVPGRLYTVVVSTWSGKYETSASTDGRTFPAAVRSLVLAGQGTEDLHVSWLTAPGDVDHYEVQLLFNDMKVFPPITLGSGVGECILSSLTPGRQYKILVSTFSGPNQHAQFIEGRTVPSKVKNIHVNNNGDSSSLTVSWTPGQGDTDGFTVFLYRLSRQLDMRHVLKHQNEVTFGSLQPGQLYGITVQSVSGELDNNSTASGRTG